MTIQSTSDKLIEMRMTVMADAFRTQVDDPKMKDIPFEDRFAMLVDVEYNNRKSNSLKRLIRNAGFDQPEAHISDIDYTSGRKLNRSLIEKLATCEYITDHRNVFIFTGDVRNHSRYSVRGIIPVAGMISLAGTTALLRKQSSIASGTMDTR